MTIIVTLFGLCVLLAGAMVLMYNGLVRARNLVQEGWSGIDVQLKRRANLIPNLVEAVKGYMRHERGLLEKVTSLRSQSLKASDVADKARLEGALSRSLASVLAVAEAYPDLKANQNFLDLQAQLAAAEEEIQLARRYYNGTVRDLNTKIESFPGNMIAGFFGFKKAEFFEIEDPGDRQVPKVQF